MIIGGRRASFLLFAGDLVAFAVSLYLTLWLRYGVLPRAATLAPYVVPFTFLFILWILVFYSAGLYSKRLVLFPSRLPDALFKTQIANIFFAALFFFLIPTFGITPKTILALYLIVSLALIFFWRLVVYPRLSIHQNRERAILLAQGAEAGELFAEVNGNPRYGIEFVSRELGDARTTMCIVDIGSVDSTARSGLTGEEKQVISFEDMYEEVFDRIPLSRLENEWFRENVAKEDPLSYAIAKRGIDIVGGLIMGLVTLVVAPFIWIVDMFEGPGPLFLRQERFGRYGTRIRVYKFRSMQKDISASREWTHEGENRVTKVGNFLRKTSLDEFPQFLNILKGELSLIGPRNDILGLGERLAESLPYYKERYAVVPGITGWAQINQQYEQGNVSPQSIEETKVRLAYDFYYLKHRSLGLDIIIALKTIKRMFFRVSSW
jgi:lipopolysaccharide/colanic/teichoic acid biosynthesis glycosyltransferase